MEIKVDRHEIKSVAIQFLLQTFRIYQHELLELLVVKLARLVN